MKMVNAQLKQMIHRNSLLIIPECPRMFGLGHQKRCWVGLHTNRIGPANGDVLLYRKNGCSSGRQRGPTEPAAHIRRRTGCGSEVCEPIPPGASPNAYRCDHRGGGVLRGKGFGSRQGDEKVGNTRIVVGSDLSASVRDMTMSTNVSVPR
ncbi:hypothetical protein B0H14DRAFT_2828826 [Mycena olivaceomarginata]|nr:hypothetical protein B0H14DRAFT_2828826 [Mycena olivaceomarginata]